MSIETLNNSNEDLIQERLKELKEQIKPGVVKFENESRDKKYNIYSYTLVQGGTKGGIKNKYINQIGPRIEGTQFTDKNGNEIKKDKFDAGEKVFLRVPKKKETINQKEKKNTPGKVEYIGNKKDKQNRNWKFYSYTFEKGGTLGGVSDKWREQIELRIGQPLGEYCDINGNELKKERFGKGETIYIKIPNTDIIDPTPEMSLNEIMKLSKNDLRTAYYNAISHKDKNGSYKIFHNRKLYYLRNGLKNNRTYITGKKSESQEDYIAIGKKVGNKITGIFWNYDKIYKGNLKYDSEFDGLYPDTGKENYYRY